MYRSWLQTKVNQEVSGVYQLSIDQVSIKNIDQHSTMDAFSNTHMIQKVNKDVPRASSLTLYKAAS